jgi:hypothetical protein
MDSRFLSAGSSYALPVAETSETKGPPDNLQKYLN